jgi:nucleotidyltransferase substrate binding protein (TIGR01987 family)
MAETPSPRIQAFEHALQRLMEALAKPEDSIVRDACIQRFEFTFEMAWKAIQESALAEGVECSSPRESFRVAFRLDLVGRDPRWMAMVEDRNRTSHTYDEEVAQTIYRVLPEYAELLRRLLAKLREAEQRRAEESAG